MLHSCFFLSILSILSPETWKWGLLLSACPHGDQRTVTSGERGGEGKEVKGAQAHYLKWCTHTEQQLIPLFPRKKKEECGDGSGGGGKSSPGKRRPRPRNALALFSVFLSLCLSQVHCCSDPPFIPTNVRDNCLDGGSQACKGLFVSAADVARERGQSSLWPSCKKLLLLLLFSTALDMVQDVPEKSLTLFWGGGLCSAVNLSMKQLWHFWGDFVLQYT